MPKSEAIEELETNNAKRGIKSKLLKIFQSAKIVNSWIN